MSEYRTDAWKRTRDGTVETAMIDVNEDTNTVEVSYELFAHMLSDLGFERA